MERLFTKVLLEWKKSLNRKPLILKGARQVGKTYVLREFGKKYYENYVYIHFEGNNEALEKIFAPDLNPHRIIQELEIFTGQKIHPLKTLIIFDEIQASERALNSLKYFCEEANEYHVVSAGSLLGLALNRGHYSFPVGKVDIYTMYPMSFEEFLMATNNKLLIDKIRESYTSFTPINEVYHQRAIDLYHTYLFVGGYPSIVNEYVETKDFIAVQALQANICDAYLADMNKYATQNETIKSMAIYNTIQSQLAKENTKFQYALIKSNARSKDYELSLQWLKAASVILENIKITEGRLPLSIYEQIDSFKIYYSDVGLLSFKFAMRYQDILVNSEFSSRARGLLGENYVAEQLTAKNIPLYYWESNGTAEVDFVLRIAGDVIPLEVKSNDNVRSRSLNAYMAKYKPPYAIRLSTKNFGYENNIKSIPLYALFCLEV